MRWFNPMDAAFAARIHDKSKFANAAKFKPKKLSLNFENIKNVTPTKSILKFIRLRSPKSKIIFLSSYSVYGKKYHRPIKETFKTRPISDYGINKKFAEGITIIKLEEGKLHQRLDAKSMSWVDSLSSWILSNYSIRTFNSYGVETNVMISEKDTLFSFDLTPEDISQKFKSPEELNYKELTKRIALLKENGVKTTRWEVEQYFKVSFAFTNLIVILFGLPLVVIKHKGGLSFGAGMSVFVIFGYYAFIKFGQSLGYKEVLEPLASAWIGNVVFSIGGLILLFFTRK